MADNMPNKTAMADNQLAHELMVVREKMRDRLMIEGNKPYYKVRKTEYSLYIGHLWQNIVFSESK